jgi:hypothetical protein
MHPPAAPLQVGAVVVFLAIRDGAGPSLGPSSGVTLVALILSLVAVCLHGLASFDTARVRANIEDLTYRRRVASLTDEETAKWDHALETLVEGARSGSGPEDLVIATLDLGWFPEDATLLVPRARRTAMVRRLPEGG